MWARCPVSTPTHIMLSPAQVAQRCATSRRSVMRAIERLELKATRDNRNHWKVSAEEADRWASAHRTPSDHCPPQTPPPAQSEITPELAASRAENDQLKERLKATETDRDHWRDLANKLADRPRWVWPWRRR